MTDVEKWEDARVALEGADSVLHDALDGFMQHAPIHVQSKLKVIKLKYKYGDLLLSEGQPFQPDGSEFPKNFIVSDFLPFGIITKGCLDVVDGADSLTKNTQTYTRSVAQLGRGQLIGAFEMLDFMRENSNSAYPDWTILSGSNCIEPLENLTTNVKYSALKRKHGLDLPLPDFKKETLFGRKILPFRQNIKKIDDWYTEIIFFDKNWVEEIFNNNSEGFFGKFRLLASNEIKDKTWSEVTRSRNIHTASNKYFHNVEKNSKSARNKANISYRLYEVFIDITLGRRPLYIYDDTTDQAAPMRGISEDFLIAAGLRGGMMRPSFISPEVRSGFVPFSCLLPDLVAGVNATTQSLETITNCLSEICNAKGHLPPSFPNDHLPYLRHFQRLIPHLKIKAPGEGGTVQYKGFSYNNRLNTKKIDIDDYFLAEEKAKDYKNSNFFRHCLRIDLHNFSWNNTE